MPPWVQCGPDDTKLTVQCTAVLTVLTGGLYLRGCYSWDVQKGAFLEVLVRKVSSHRAITGGLRGYARL